MNWIDFLTIGIVVVVAVIFALRGREFVSAALFDAGAIVLAAWTGHKAHPGAAELLNISPLLAYIIIFVVVGAVMIFVSAKLHQLTQWDFHPFNALVSFFLGIIAAWAIAYVVLEAMLVGTTPGSDTRYKISESPVAAEILTFRTLTGTKEFMDTVRFIQREPWEQREGWGKELPERTKSRGN